MGATIFETPEFEEITLPETANGLKVTKSRD